MATSVNAIKTSRVFTPGTTTKLTYVDRDGAEATMALREHVRRGGYLVSIVGPTKMGKTVLIRKEAPSAFFISGDAIKSTQDFWLRLAAFLEIPQSSTHATVTSDKSKWGFLGRLGIGGVGVGTQVGGEHSRDHSQADTQALPADQAVLDAAHILYENDEDFTIVVDDFHFIAVGVRKQLVQALKPLAFAGAAILIVTLPHRRSETSDVVGDMGGRTDLIKVNPWSEPDLAKIATIGFAQLNLRDPLQLAERLAAESYGSPHLMQRLCLDLCERTNGVLWTLDEPRDLLPPDDWPTFFRSVRDENSSKWLTRLVLGPKTRGTQRRQFALTDERSLDGYQVILLALKQLGPRLSVPLSEMDTQIDSMLASARASSVNTRSKLSHMNDLADSPLSSELPIVSNEDEAFVQDTGQVDLAAGTPQPVFEYQRDPVRPTVNILEPYLAYALKWHSDTLFKG